MANTIERITKYITNAVDTVFAQESKTALLENGSKFIDTNFNETGYIKLYNLLMDGLSDYYRANSNEANGGYANYNGVGHNDGYKVGNVQGKWEIYQLKHDRGRQFQIDEMDDEETAGLILANLVTEFTRTKVVPEVDETRFSEIASKTYASLGNKVTETPVTTKGSANEITHLWNKAFEWLTEMGVPEEEQVIFVNPSIETIISNSEEIYKTLTQADYVSERGVTFSFKAYKNRPIVVVPSDRFYTDVVLNDNGYRPGSGSKLINYIIASKKAVVPVVKVEKSKVFGPGVVQDFDGYKLNFRIYHDLIIPKNKAVGCYVSLSATDATSVSSYLKVALTQVETNEFKLDAYYSNPTGLLGTVKLVDNATNAYGSVAVGSAFAGGTEVVEGINFETQTGKTYYFVLVDSSNKVIAKTKATVISNGNIA